MSRLTCGLATAILIVLSGPSYGAKSLINPGSSATTGPSSNPYSVFGAHINPAAGDTLIAPDERWRMNLLPSVTLGLEIGPVDNFVDDLDELVDLLDDPGMADGSVEETRDRFNQTLESAGDHGYLRLDTLVSAPLFPLHWRPEFIQGTFSAEINVTGQAHLSVLDEELDYDSQNEKFVTGTAAYIKSGLETTFSVAYSRPLLAPTNAKGQLYVGVKLNAYQLELSKQVFLLQLLDGRSIDELVQDEYDRNAHSSTGVGIDASLLWQNSRFSSGITFANINEPRFEYGAIGIDCNSRAETDAQSNCRAAAAFADEGELRQLETHTKHALATMENSVFLTPRWLLTSAVDLADYNDMVGDEHQWVSAATAYYPHSAWIPALRAGYKKNLTGSELSSVTAGVTLFGSLTFDLEWGLEDVTVDGNTAPRRMGLALSFEERF